MYCYNCMKEAQSRAVCPYCHKQNVPDRIVHHLSPGTVLNGHYVVGNSLGEGGFGITYIGRDTNLKMRVAIKEYYPSGNVNRNNTQSNEVYTATESQKEAFEKGKERFLREAQSIAKFSGSKGVVNIKTYFEEHNTAYIIMDYIDGENLLQYMDHHGKFSGDTIFRLMLPVMESLKHIHDEEVIHRDISPDNIIYGTNGMLTLTDFGSARYFTSQSKEMSVMLKQGYAPEEQYRSTGAQGPWTDIYGLCATIYKCITGVTPQTGLDRAHSDSLKAPSEIGADISPALESVLMYGLSVFRNDRCQSMGELIDLTKNALDNNTAPVLPGLYGTRTVSANNGVYPPTVTTPNNLSYGDRYNNGNIKTNVDPTQQKQAPQQSKAPVIAAVVIAAAAVILAVVIMFIILGNKDNSDNTSGTSATTAAETQNHNVKAQVIVPELSGKTRTEAIKILDDAQLDYETVSKSTDKLEEDNKVIEQSPANGKTVNEGDKITLYIGEYKEPETDAPTEAETEAAKTILYCCASEDATLRDAPSKSGNKLLSIKSREAVEYLDTANDFYKVKYNGVTGYVWSVCFSPDKNAPLYYGTGNESSGSSSTGSKILYCIATDNAHLWKTANPDDHIDDPDHYYYVIPRYETVRLISDYGDFYKVKYGSYEGYVLKEAFSPDKYATPYGGN
ncbi:MAG: protein kinase [Ruminococcus sp.]|nr:protein kinase [Ruminococcus sp.]